MSMSPVQRVASAMARTNKQNPDQTLPSGVRVWRLYADEARAALLVAAELLSERGKPASGAQLKALAHER